MKNKITLYISCMVLVVIAVLLLFPKFSKFFEEPKYPKIECESIDLKYDFIHDEYVAYCIIKNTGDGDATDSVIAIYYYDYFGKEYLADSFLTGSMKAGDSKKFTARFYDFGDYGVQNPHVKINY